MNDNFLILEKPYMRQVINGRIYQNECAITSTIEKDGVPTGSCLMYGELSTMLPDYQSGRPKWNQPTTAYRFKNSEDIAAGQMQNS